MSNQMRMGLSAMILLALCLLSLGVGAYPLTFGDIGGILTGEAADSMAAQVFFRLRIPRTMMAVFAGAALSLSGGVYQLIFQNPLASPDLTGVSSGAACGAAAAILFTTGGMVTRMSGAFLGGILALLLTLLLVRMAGNTGSGTYILAGMIVSAGADAILMVLKSAADPERELAAIEFWTMGSLSAVTASTIWTAAVPILVGGGLLLLFASRAAMLSLPDEDVRTMGLAPGKWRCILSVLSTLIAASVIALTGVISFTGLIAPHIAYRIWGRRTGGFLPLSALLGGILTIAADMLARWIGGGAEWPLSVFTVGISAPMLAWLMICGRREEGIQ